MILDSDFLISKLPVFPAILVYVVPGLNFIFLCMFVIMVMFINDFETKELISRLSMIVRVNVVLNMIVVVDIQ